MKQVFLGKVTKSGLSFSEGNKIRLNLMSQDWEGEKVRVTIETVKRPKTEQALGYYWGALLPAYVAHRKDLITKESISTNPYQLKDLLKARKMTSDEISSVHRTFMYEFAPQQVRTLNGDIHRERGEMKKMNNTQLIQYCTVVQDYFEANGIPIPNTEEYKYFRDVILNGMPAENEARNNF